MEEQKRIARAAGELLHHADTAWQTATGRFTEWWDQSVLDPGRARYHREQGNASSDEDIPERESYPREVCQSQRSYRFWSRTSPWGLRLESMPDPLDPEGNARGWRVMVMERRTWSASYAAGRVGSGAMTPDQVVVDRDRNRWAVYGDEVVPDLGNWEQSTGVPPLDLLLRPSRLAPAFDLVAGSAIDVQGRAALQVVALPGPEEAFFFAALGLVALSATPYVLTLDASTGIVVDVQAYIDDDLAQRQTITDLRTDEPIAEDLFRPVA